MEIGFGHHISDAFFPKDKKINIKDREGNKLAVGDKVKIRGCRADYGYIGYDGVPVLYFATKDTSCRWAIDSRIASLLTKISVKSSTFQPVSNEESEEIESFVDYLKHKGE